MGPRPYRLVDRRSQGWNDPPFGWRTTRFTFWATATLICHRLFETEKRRDGSSFFRLQLLKKQLWSVGGTRVLEALIWNLKRIKGLFSVSEPIFTTFYQRVQGTAMDSNGKRWCSSPTEYRYPTTTMARKTVYHHRQFQVNQNARPDSTCCRVRHTC